MLYAEEVCDKENTSSLYSYGYLKFSALSELEKIKNNLFLVTFFMHTAHKSPAHIQSILKTIH